MLLHKTERARVALADRSFGLSALERRILILCDGRRTVDVLASMLGTDARAAVTRLLADGYLAAPPAAAGEGDGAGALGTARRLLGAIAPRRDAAAQEHLTADPPAPPGAAPIPASAGTTPRRSLAASKMYVLDMLRLQRNAEARALEAAVQASDPARLPAVLLEALAFLQRATPESYSRRVLDRVAEILPEDALPMLQAQREAIASAA